PETLKRVAALVIGESTPVIPNDDLDVIFPLDDNHLDPRSDGRCLDRVIDVVVQDLSNCEVVVRDHGRGLTDDQRRNAFERFWRAPGDSNRRSGSGLGLAIVAQLANAAAVRVELRSSPSGGIDASVTVALAKS
ncbi:MAG: ATP-binding protein, partial [Actinobacteria bacterium]|nr:ATP-binding protein [Actinomycetota bacterium]